MTDKSYKYGWVKNSSIFVRKTDTSKIIRIREDSDLLKILRICKLYFLTLSAVFCFCFFVVFFVTNDAFNEDCLVCGHCILRLPCDMAHPFMLIVFCYIMGLIEHCICVDVNYNMKYYISNVNCDVFRFSFLCPRILSALGSVLVLMAARYVEIIVPVACFFYD